MATTSSLSLVPALRLLAERLPGADAPPARSAIRSSAEAIRSRHPGAWRVLYEDARESLYRYAYSRLGHEADAEDLVAHVFEEAWEHANRYQDHGLPPRAWLFGIARNLVRMRRRALFRRPPVLALEAFDQPVSERAMSAELLDLARGIQKLPADQAEVITLRFLHDLSVEETAAVLKVPPSTVKGRQLRALERLRDSLGPEHATLQARTESGIRGA